MTFFKKREFKNKLTESIQTGNPTLEDVLLDENFHMTIRNESNILYNRILQKENGWIYDIFEYALNGKEPPTKYKEYNKINQINKNAAAFLENCGKKFIQYFKNESNVSINQNALYQPKELIDILYYYIKEFTNEQQKKYEDRLYAGSFQRFIENFLRNEALDVQKTIEKLANFLVRNCRILAYQQLIMKLLSDYCNNIGDKDDATYKNLLLEILKRAASAVNFITKQKEDESPQSVFNVTSVLNKTQKITEKNQPLNLAKKPIPLAGVDFDKSANIQDLKKSVKNKYLPKFDDTVTYKDKEDAEFEAYLLLMSIRTAIFDQTAIVDYFRNQKDFEFIKYLLYCGTRSDVKSLVSLESFRILSIIFNGSKGLLIDSWKSSEKEKSEIPFYNIFADEMIFDPTCLTYKMIHALPVFWNHKYNTDSYELSDEEREENDVSDYYQDGKSHIRKRENGETALEILQPCLFCEPPVSSQLIYSCTDIFIQLAKERKEFTKIKKLESKDSDLAVYLDGIILDFYQHHFQFGKLTDISFWKLIKKDAFPLAPTDDYYFNDEKNRRRALLNGFIVDFLLRMTSMRTNTFFQLAKAPVTKIASRKKCLSVNNLIFAYQEFTNFELLAENTIYNKPIHDEYFFDEDTSNSNINDNGLPTEKKFNINVKSVAVDEFAKSYNSTSQKFEKQDKKSKGSQSTRPSTKKNMTNVEEEITKSLNSLKKKPNITKNDDDESGSESSSGKPKKTSKGNKNQSKEKRPPKNVKSDGDDESGSESSSGKPKKKSKGNKNQSKEKRPPKNDKSDGDDESGSESSSGKPKKTSKGNKNQPKEKKLVKIVEEDDTSKKPKKK